MRGLGNTPDARTLVSAGFFACQYVAGTNGRSESAWIETCRYRALREPASWSHPTFRRRKLMPTIAHFYGVIIQMYYDQHEPPHFHARYGGAKPWSGSPMAKSFQVNRRRQPLAWCVSGLWRAGPNCRIIGAVPVRTSLWKR